MCACPGQVISELQVEFFCPGVPFDASQANSVGSALLASLSSSPTLQEHNPRVSTNGPFGGPSRDLLVPIIFDAVASVNGVPAEGRSRTVILEKISNLLPGAGNDIMAQVSGVTVQQVTFNIYCSNPSKSLSASLC